MELQIYGTNINQVSEPSQYTKLTYETEDIIETLPSSLESFVNLKKLCIKGSHLWNIDCQYIPKTVEYIDITSAGNIIEKFYDDLHRLPNLHTLVVDFDDLVDNMFSGYWPDIKESTFYYYELPRLNMLDTVMIDLQGHYEPFTEITTIYLDCKNFEEFVCQLPFFQNYNITSVKRVYTSILDDFISVKLE